MYSMYILCAENEKNLQFCIFSFSIFETSKQSLREAYNEQERSFERSILSLQMHSLHSPILEGFKSPTCSWGNVGVVDIHC